MVIGLVCWNHSDSRIIMWKCPFYNCEYLKQETVLLYTMIYLDEIIHLINIESRGYTEYYIEPSFKHFLVLYTQQTI